MRLRAAHTRLTAPAILRYLGSASDHPLRHLGSEWASWTEASDVCLSTYESYASSRAVDT